MLHALELALGLVILAFAIRGVRSFYRCCYDPIYRRIESRIRAYFLRRFPSLGRDVLVTFTVIEPSGPPSRFGGLDFAPVVKEPEPAATTVQAGSQQRPQSLWSQFYHGVPPRDVLLQATEAPSVDAQPVEEELPADPPVTYRFVQQSQRGNLITAVSVDSILLIETDDAGGFIYDWSRVPDHIVQEATRRQAELSLRREVDGDDVFFIFRLAEPEN